MADTLVIDISDQAVRAAMNNLSAGVSPASFLPALGEDQVSRVKERFATSTDPAGNAWARNSAVTIARYLAKTSGNFKKNGDLSKKGQARSDAKKPLIGESHALSTTIFYQVESSTLVMGSPLPYAAVQHYGAIQGEFGRDKRNHPLPWGDIPARPFMPITPMGELYPEERERILAMLGATIQQSFKPA